MSNDHPKRNIRLVILESALTSGLLSVPIMTPFYLSLGLTQEEISLTQMAFTAAIMLLNVPLGWVADRFSRKWANIVGDCIHALALLLYSTVNSFWSIVGCEILCGVGSALSQGVDSTLLKHFAGKIDPSNRLFEDKYGQMTAIKQVANIIILALGGPIGAIDFRLAIAVSAIPSIIAAIVCLFIHDDSPRLLPKRNTFCDIFELVHRNFHNKKLRLRLFAFAVSREVTHGIVWIFTPLMLMAGVPLSIVSMGWILNSVAAIFGTQLARRFLKKSHIAALFIVPIGLVTLASLVIYCNLSMATIPLLTLFGIAGGWSATSVMPKIKEQTQETEQTTVESLAQVMSQLLYLVVVWAVGCAADISLQFALLAIVAIFVPLAVPIFILLHQD